MKIVDMKAEEFNIKYKDYLEEGHYGLAFNDPGVMIFLDDIFQDLIKIPGFKYSQIKLKFGKCRRFQPQTQADGPFI